MFNDIDVLLSFADEQSTKILCLNLVVGLIK